MMDDFILGFLAGIITFGGFWAAAYMLSHKYARGGLHDKKKPCNKINPDAKCEHGGHK